MKYFKQLFAQLTSRQIAEKELRDAEIALLEAQSAREYASGIVAYREAQIKRLKSYLEKTE